MFFARREEMVIAPTPPRQTGSEAGRHEDEAPGAKTGCHSPPCLLHRSPVRCGVTFRTTLIYILSDPRGDPLERGEWQSSQTMVSHSLDLVVSLSVPKKGEVLLGRTGDDLMKVPALSRTLC